MHFYRIRFIIAGSHIHCSLFVSDTNRNNWALCGKFAVRRGDEFASLIRAFKSAQFIPEVEAEGIEEAIRN